MSAAWQYLRSLQVGDAVPEDLYVLDYRDDTRPTWTVHAVEELADTGGRVMVLVDRLNSDDADLFGGGLFPAVRVITHPNKTLRTQPYPLGGHPGYTLCDMDQQGRNAARRPK